MDDRIDAGLRDVVPPDLKRSPGYAVFLTWIMFFQTARVAVPLPRIFRVSTGLTNNWLGIDGETGLTRTITGWRLPVAERDPLLRKFPPHYAEVVADHVTLRYGTDEQTALPTARSGEVVGEVDDGEGIHALVVRIDGTTDRGDGSHYHITWSLGPGRHAKESNDAIAAHVWKRVHPPVRFRLTPDRWKR